MNPKKKYEFRKLNSILSSSFNNIRYDIRSLNERVEVLDRRVDELSTTPNSSEKEQNQILIKQQRMLQMLNTRLDELENKKHSEKKNNNKNTHSQIKEGEVKITALNLKAEGNGKKNLNGEWIEITGYNVDLTGYKLLNKNRKTYNFPAGFIIYGPIKVFTGKGKNTNTKLYWNNPIPIWNDKSDTATLKNDKGIIVSKVKSESKYTFDPIK